MPKLTVIDPVGMRNIVSLTYDFDLKVGILRHQECDIDSWDQADIIALFERIDPGVERIIERDKKSDRSVCERENNSWVKIPMRSSSES